ncbi:hypothetical protein RHOFW510R12_29800, partial [Rhodanobacter sp. FW510-R12]
SQVTEQRVMLEYQPDIAIAGSCRQKVAIPLAHIALIRIVEAGKDAKECGLARAGWTEQGQKFPGRQVQADVVECGEIGKAAAEVIDD